MNTVYLAGPLFSKAERNWLRTVKALLTQAGLIVIWPWERVEQDALNCSPSPKQHIFEACRRAIHESDFMAAWLDGPLVDDGTAWEIGYAYAKGIPVYGLRTDLRRAGETSDSVVNCMIECACEKIFGSVDELVQHLGQQHLPDSKG